MDFAIALTRADKGNIQLLDPDTQTLMIAASRGFDPSFLDYFAEVPAGPESACGLALATRQRVIVEDVEASEIFAGKPALGVMLAADVRAVHSMPIVSRAGRFCGVLSTHWRNQYPEADYDPALIEYLVEETAEFLEREAQGRGG